MKILVTGGAGFIGSQIVDAYIDAGHQVDIVDDLSTGKEENISHITQPIAGDGCGGIPSYGILQRLPIASKYIDQSKFNQFIKDLFKVWHSTNNFFDKLYALNQTQSLTPLKDLSPDFCITCNTKHRFESQFKHLFENTFKQIKIHKHT